MRSRGFTSKDPVLLLVLLKHLSTLLSEENRARRLLGPPPKCHLRFVGSWGVVYASAGERLVCSLGVPGVVGVTTVDSGGEV